jgi:Tat protein translocase TatC
MPPAVASQTSTDPVLTHERTTSACPSAGIAHTAGARHSGPDAGFLGLFHWSGDIYHLLAKPLLDALPNGGSMIATEVTATFFVPMKLTMLVAFLISLPNTLYQVWAFVAPGLYSHEKRLILPLVVASVLLFLLGMSFAYFLVFPVAFHFFSMMTPSGVSMMTDIDKYLSLSWACSSRLASLLKYPSS